MGKTFISDISGHKFPVKQKVPGNSIRTRIIDLIRQDHPDFDVSKNISSSELSVYREKYIENYLKEQVGKLSELEGKVLESISDQTLITDEAVRDGTDKTTVGDRVADDVARFGGSWKFIISFGLFILLWIFLNVWFLANKGFDPYPFILLNLILSCLAAIQAPVIMMSQNRQEAKDRARSQEDYMVNLKAELEVRSLHEKMDHLMMYQQQELIEIQKLQIDMLNDIIRKLSGYKPVK